MTALVTSLPNLSYPLLALTWVQAHFASLRFVTVRLGVVNNVNPRETLDMMEKSGKYSKTLMGKLRRRQAAHENCLDGLGIFGAAVVAGNVSGLSKEYMTGMAATYFIARCLFIYWYITITSQKWSFLRTATWWTSSLCVLTTFIKCYNATKHL